MWVGSQTVSVHSSKGCAVLVGMWVVLTQHILSLGLLLFCNIQINGKDKLLKRNDLREYWDDSEVFVSAILANIFCPFPVFFVPALSQILRD
jgi:hypothetical protein